MKIKPVEKFFAVVGVFYMLWIVSALMFHFPGPWGINR